MNKTTLEALKLAEEALDELRYANDTDIAKTKYYKALAAIRDANEMVMDWSKVKPEAINSDPMYQMGYAAAMSKFAAQFQAKPVNTRSSSEYSEPVKQEPVAWLYDWEHEGEIVTGWVTQDFETTKFNNGHNVRPLYAAPVQHVKQEPVAKFLEDNLVVETERIDNTGHRVLEIREEELLRLMTLYAAPVERQWVDLTDKEQIEIEGSDEVEGEDYNSGYTAYNPYAIMDLAIAKFKEKNTPPVVPQGEPFRCTNDDCVDAKAIRAEALEEAAKFFEGKVGQADLRDIAAAIRGLR